jgi:quinolinate synthase
MDARYHVPQEELAPKIAARKKELGASLLILGHHYQQESVYRFADLTGDSLILSRNAAESKDAEYIVFGGVHFMAEAADILTSDEQAVILPDLLAGCPMADMATRHGVEDAWDELREVTNDRIVPITYVNSSADIKAFVGMNGGSVCTSSNAERVLTWALSTGEKVFFFPDEHLGRNSAYALGISSDEVVVWKRGLSLGGCTAGQLKKAKVILWDGYCTVHMHFSAEHIAWWRAREPELKIIVHPECRNDVVAKADMYGSTEGIITAVKDSPSGSKWAIGTEINLVARLQEQHPDKEVHPLGPIHYPCVTMARISPGSLLWVLDNLTQGNVVNQISVPLEVAEHAKMALDRMLKI